jgi:hypothetical protein
MNATAISNEPNHPRHRDIEESMVQPMCTVLSRARKRHTAQPSSKIAYGMQFLCVKPALLSIDNPPLSTGRAGSMSLRESIIVSDPVSDLF